MPFRSARQRRWMFANIPKVARRWAKESGGKARRSGKAKGGKKKGQASDVCEVRCPGGTSQAGRQDVLVLGLWMGPRTVDREPLGSPE